MPSPRTRGGGWGEGASLQRSIFFRSALVAQVGAKPSPSLSPNTGRGVKKRSPCGSAQRPAVLFQALHQLARFLFAFADAAGPRELLILSDGLLDSATRADHRAVI